MLLNRSQLRNKQAKINEEQQLGQQTKTDTHVAFQTALRGLLLFTRRVSGDTQAPPGHSTGARGIFASGGVQKQSPKRPLLQPTKWTVGRKKLPLAAIGERALPASERAWSRDPKQLDGNNMPLPRESTDGRYKRRG